MFFPKRAFSPLKLKRKLSKKARSTLATFSQYEQELLVEVMSQGPKSLKFVNWFLELGRTDAVFVHKSIVRQGVKVAYLEDLISQDISAMLANIIINNFGKTIDEASAEELIEIISSNDEIDAYRQVDLAQDLALCDGPKEVKEVVNKARDNPEKYFNRYKNLLKARKKKPST